jgi:mono/diheme cytochrome c family protein
MRVPSTLRSTRLINAAAVLVAAIVLWALARPLPEAEQHRRHFADLQQQVALVQQTKGARATDRGQVMRLRAQARGAAGAQRAAFEAQAAAIESRLAWGSREVVRAAVYSAPFVSLRRRTALTGFSERTAGQGSGCQSCHVPVAASGFERYPAPFGTHPNLAAYVGAASPHPPSRVDCTSCHMGDAYADTFAGAGHVRAADDRRPQPVVVRAWAGADASGAMLPLARTEAGCATCHLGERYQPGATALNEALVTFERAGCYACHAAPGFERTPKRGPDLRRITGKLSRDWVRAWVADPAAIKPATWMPSFFQRGAALGADERATIEAITAYLFANSDSYTPVAGNTKGDAARGQMLVPSVGCLGCHIVGDAARESAGLRRTFGQPLQGLAAKADVAWLADWLRDPARFSPGTRMPNLRLSEAEAADVAAYLKTLGAPALPVAQPAGASDDAYRGVLRRYDASTPPATLTLTGDALAIAAGRTAIDALGCFNCHEVRGYEGRATTVPIRRRQDWTTADIAGLSHPGPKFRVSGGEAARLALALTVVAGRQREQHALTTPWQLTKSVGRTLVQERNCVGCHQLEGTGGDFVSLVAEPPLGPPLLTPEGSRVQPDWLRRFLHRPVTIRPWLSVRMPTFGLSDDDVEAVGNYFRGIAPENPKPVPGTPDVTPARGKALFELLKCQQCHVLGAVPKDQPTSNLAPDLRLAHERLQPEWILAWLRNPGALLPGTRMPSFWPDYPKSFYEPLDRDGQKQVRAIRDHLLTLH